MNAAKRSVARAGLVLGSAMAFALTGCQTHVVQSRAVYVPTPAPPVVYAPQPPPPAVVIASPEYQPVVVIQSENDFYEPLGAYGRWEVVGSYGRCWIPARVEAGWRPYSNGYWQRTDAGWYWASEEPWGWATYHYGRWDYHSHYGWIWLPQTQWAPAWVAWREGNGYVGWAPLRPSVRVGVTVSTVDYEPAFASRAFVFVEHRQMLEPVRPKTVIVNNTTIINKTVNITNVKIVNKTVINEGPRTEVIERASGRKIQAVAARDFRHREETTVAARERNIPTNRDRNVQPAARTEPQPVKQPAVLPRAAHATDKPAVVVKPTPRPIAPQAPVRPEVRNPANEEKNREAARKFNTPAAQPRPGAEPRREEAVPRGRDARPIEQPTVATKPVTNSAPANQRREELRSKPNPERPAAPVPPAVAVQPGATPGVEPAQQPQVAPKWKSRAAERAEENKKRKEDREQKKKKNDEQEAGDSNLRG